VSRLSSKCFFNSLGGHGHLELSGHDDDAVAEPAANYNLQEAACLERDLMPAGKQLHVHRQGRAGCGGLALGGTRTAALGAGRRGLVEVVTRPCVDVMFGEALLLQQRIYFVIWKALEFTDLPIHVSGYEVRSQMSRAS